MKHFSIQASNAGLNAEMFHRHSLPPFGPIKLTYARFLRMLYVDTSQIAFIGGRHSVGAVALPRLQQKESGS
jgi:hypothetical protein